MEWAAEYGNTLAQHWLVLFYLTGRGVSMIHRMTYFWLNLAARSKRVTAEMERDRDVALGGLTAATVERCSRSA